MLHRAPFFQSTQNTCIQPPGGSPFHWCQLTMAEIASLSLPHSCGVGGCSEAMQSHPKVSQRLPRPEDATHGKAGGSSTQVPPT